jgi:uncharacterized protein with FMN-binding domain
MKKLFLTIFVFATSAGYVLYLYTGGTQANAQPLVPSTPTNTVTVTPVATTPVVITTPIPSPTPTPTPKSSPTPVPTPTPVAVPPKPMGQYVDGSYTGSPADAYYGTVQVQAVIQGGKLVTVNFLSYPSDRRTSQSINSQAIPLLQQEAIQAQSANVNTISGASDTSAAFIQSLSSALTQAKNG